MTIGLPVTRRRAALRAFWFIVSFGFGLVLGLLLWALGSGWASGVAAGVSVAVLSSLFVFWREEAVWRLYWAWNRRLAHPVGKRARRLLMRICYFVIFAAVGRKGSLSRMVFKEDGSSLWTGRSSLPAEAYPALFAAGRQEAEKQGWVRNYAYWAIRSDNAWAVSLIPFLALLRRLEMDENKPVAANIYTLF